VIFAGGSNGGANGDAVDIFHANGTRTSALLSAPRKFLEGAGRGNVAAFGGGVVPFISAFTPSNVVDIYHSATNTWTTGTLSVARAFLGAAATSRHIFFAGGSSASGDVATVDIYEISTGVWTTANLSVAREGLRGTATSTKAFFGGGYTAGGDVVDIFDEVTGTWSTAKLSVGRGFPGAAATEDFVIFAGGYTIQGASITVADIYNVRTGVWSTAGVLSDDTTGTASPTALFFTGAFNSNNVDVFTETVEGTTTASPPPPPPTTTTTTTTTAPPPTTTTPSPSSTALVATTIIGAPSPIPSSAGPVWKSVDVRLTSDSLLIHFTSYNSFNIDGSPSFGYSQLNFFLDLDNNAATGFNVARAGFVGSDALIQGTGIYAQSAGVWNAGSKGTATASAVRNVNDCVLTVPLSALRSIVANINTVRLVGYNDQLGSYYPSERSYLSFSI